MSIKEYKLSTSSFYKDKFSPIIESTFYFIGILVIIYGAIDTFVYSYKNYLKRKDDDYEYFISDIRIRLSSSFSLALTYILGAEIIKTFRIPNIKQLVKITGLIFIRQLVSYFLDKDVKNLKQFSKK